MNIKTIDQSDLDNICLIHKLSFDSSHFTSVLPMDLLKEYYQKIIENCEYRVIVYDNDLNKAVGFAIGARKISDFLNTFIKEHFFKLLLILIKNPKFLIEKVIGVLFSLIAKKSAVSKAEAILLSITVNPKNEMRRKGQIVLNEFENVLKKDGIKVYSLGVRKNNSKAVNFYQRNGFSLEYSEKESDYYTKTFS